MYFCVIIYVNISVFLTLMEGFSDLFVSKSFDISFWLKMYALWFFLFTWQDLFYCLYHKVKKYITKINDLGMAMVYHTILACYFCLIPHKITGRHCSTMQHFLSSYLNSSCTTELYPSSLFCTSSPSPSHCCTAILQVQKKLVSLQEIIIRNRLFGA